MAEKTKEQDLKKQLSDAENANNLLSRDLAAAQKQAAKSDELEDEVQRLEVKLATAVKQVAHLEHRAATAEAKVERQESRDA